MKYCILLLALSSTSILAERLERDVQLERGLAATTTTTITGISTISGSTTSSSSVITASPSSSGSSTLGCANPPPASTVNPVSIPVPSGRGISLQGSTNAAFVQRVTVSLSKAGGGPVPAPIVFEGVGEANSPMQVTPKTTPPTTCGTFVVQGNNMTVTLLFQNIDEGRVSNSTLQAFTGTSIFNFHTEDAGDCDFDDSLFTMAFQPAGSIGC
ncbi:hypothetical protein B0H34DRAFT_692697 [Crassisporium funariophilum]|nr:hypothetical protein B0H34DRAFT_692697 [Crassisporium funariophilum]